VSDTDPELSMRVGGASFYYLTDDLGSTAAVTDETGSVIRSYTYAPFGETTGSTAVTGAPANPWRFVGSHNYYTDAATGMLKVGIRYYDPGLGRWTQRDPMTNSLDPAQAGPYAYVGNNPSNKVDPTGAYGLDDFLDGEFLDIAQGCVMGAAMGTALTFESGAAALGPQGIAAAAGVGCLYGGMFGAVSDSTALEVWR
jgi:RHS repeat-associated protein